MSYKYNLVLCVCIKNEAKYMNDFLQHYIKQGVEHFYIINNNSADNISNILENYKNIITIFEDNRDLQMYSNCQGKDFQKQIYDDYFYPIIIKDACWAIIVDVDEFMYGKNGYTIKSYLETVPSDINCIYVIWNLFLPYKNDDNTITNNFSIYQNNKRLNLDLIKELDYCVNNLSNFGKSIIRTSSLTSENKLWIHRQAVNGKTMTNYGQINDVTLYDNFNTQEISEECFSKVKITLNHYPIRDLDDYKKRLSHLQYENKFAFTYALNIMMNSIEKYYIEDNSIIT
jgi:hypothetical protein